MKKIKITQVKSAIDRPERQKLTLRALGLTKMNASREVEATDQILGMVRAVNHLLRIDEASAPSGNIQESDTAVLEDTRFTEKAEPEIQKVPDSFFAQGSEEPVEDAVTVDDTLPEEDAIINEAPVAKVTIPEEETGDPVEDVVVNQISDTPVTDSKAEAMEPVEDVAIEEAPAAQVAPSEKEVNEPAKDSFTEDAPDTQAVVSEEKVKE